MKAVVAMFKPMREQMIQGKENVPDPAISVKLLLIGLAAEGYAPDPTTEAMAHLVSTQQTAEGSFRTLPGRPPNRIERNQCHGAESPRAATLR